MLSRSPCHDEASKYARSGLFKRLGSVAELELRSLRSTQSPKNPRARGIFRKLRAIDRLSGRRYSRRQSEEALCFPILSERELVQFLKRAQTKEKCFEAGVECVGGPAQELAAVKSEIDRMRKAISDAGIRID